MAFLKRSVLFVDDDPMDRKLIVSMLSQSGYVVTTVEDGFDALDMLHKYPFDLLVLDIMMKQMNGLELLKRIKAQPETKDIPVMMLSSRDEKKSSSEPWPWRAGLYDQTSAERASDSEN